METKPKKLKEPTKAQIKKWVTALRSGKYKQSIGELQNHEGYCCLGVACDIFINQKSKLLRSNGELCGTMPNSQPKAPKWLININDEFKHLQFKYGAHTYAFLLTNLNDVEKFTFDEIADVLELVYIHKAL